MDRSGMLVYPTRIYYNCGDIFFACDDIFPQRSAADAHKGFEGTEE